MYTCRSFVNKCDFNAFNLVSRPRPPRRPAWPQVSTFNCISRVSQIALLPVSTLVCCSAKDMHYTPSLIAVARPSAEGIGRRYNDV
jgi:hypothetical protein